MVLADSRRVLSDGGRVLTAQRPAHAANDDVGAITDAMSASLRRGRPDTSQLPEHAAAAGLALLERAMTPSRTFEESPAEAIAEIEQRTFSSLWDLDDLSGRTSFSRPSTSCAPSPSRRSRAAARSARRCSSLPPRREGPGQQSATAANARQISSASSMPRWPTRSVR